MSSEEAGHFCNLACMSIVAAACLLCALETLAVDSKVLNNSILQLRDEPLMLVLKPLVINCLIRQCTEGLKLNFHQNIIGGIRPQSPHGSYTTVRACIPSVHTICSCMRVRIHVYHLFMRVRLHSYYLHTCTICACV